jgi:hypothetical protein
VTITLAMALLAIAMTAGRDLVTGRLAIGVEWLLIGMIVLAVGLGAAHRRADDRDDA